MPNSAKTIFKETDQSFFIDSELQGLAVVSVETLRGPYGHDGEIMTSWTEFKKKYGGKVQGLEGPTLVKRAFERGAILRINKVGHYTDPSDPGTLDAVKATFSAGLGDGSTGAENYFTVAVKYPGKDYNNLVVVISAASNGDADSFNLEVQHLEDSTINEKYENLKIVGTPTVAESDYLDDVKSKSKLIDITYLDTSAYTGPLTPDNGTYTTSGGSDGGPVVTSDYTGDAAGGTGPYAFDGYDDFEVIAPFGDYTESMLAAYGNYAAGRQDCVAFLHLDNSNNTVALLQSARDTMALDTRYAYIVAGGVKITDPFLDGQTMEIAEVGDVVGAAMRSSVEFGPWYSFAGTERGKLINALGVVNNFAPGGSTKLDQLAQRQINVVVNKNGRNYIKGNFSAQFSTSRKSFINVVKLLIHIRKSLAPTLDRYLEQPNDYKTFRDLYIEVKPFFEGLASENARALLDWEWRGDQFANNSGDLKINNEADLLEGKYLVELYLKEVVSLQELTVNIISAPGGVSFEDNLN